MKTFVMLLTLSLLAIAPAVGAANSAVQPRIETQPGPARTEGLPARDAGWSKAKAPSGSRRHIENLQA